LGFGERALEDLVRELYRGKSVLVTGHTGFKGGWLTLWLHELGAKVHGYSLDAPTNPNLFEEARIDSLLASDTRGDLADLPALSAAISSARPEVIFHLAAQSLVRAGYCNPRETMVSNIIGTANLLDAVRDSHSVKAVVLITTDKVYQNREWPYAYREEDPLGGHDPYSASKAAAEIVAASYRASFFTRENGHPAHIATVRAGNVIGGGDWALDRLVPDCVRAFAEQSPVHLRFPGAIRPWQHVLDPLAGYLQLAQRLLTPQAEGFARAWNFGPDTGGDATVGKVAESIARLWGGDARVLSEPSAAHPHEAGLLRLDSTLARTMLGWQPRWSLQQALKQTVTWYQAWMQKADMNAICRDQISAYERADAL
jgi:CDP-glucose 4,6-dehydratase